jgi:hypothetical protein
MRQEHLSLIPSDKVLHQSLGTGSDVDTLKLKTL